MSLTKELAATHAGTFMTRAAVDMGDPRLSRMTVLDLANQISAAVQATPSSHAALFALEETLHTQLVSQETIERAERTGWPAIDGTQSSVANLLYAVGRLGVHNLIADTGGGVSQLTASQVTVPTGDDLTAVIRKAAGSLEEGFVDALLNKSIDQLGHDGGFSQRVAAAGVDCGQIFSGGEVPHYLVQLLMEHEANSGGSSTRDLTESRTPMPRTSTGHVPPWTSPLAGWIRPTPGGTPMGRNLTTQGGGGEEGGAEAGVAVVCTVGGVATGGTVFIVCVVVVVVLIIITIILVATGNKP